MRENNSSAVLSMCCIRNYFTRKSIFSCIHFVGNLMLMFVVLVLMLWQNFTTTGRNLAKPGSLCCGAAATRCCLKALVLVPVNWSNTGTTGTTGITGTTGRNSDSQFSCCDFIVCFVEVLFCFLFMFILCLSMKNRERGGG